MTRVFHLVILASFALLAIPQTPARACSCAGPFDLQTAIDESEAAFVGTLIEKRASDIEWEAIYVFEVEQWVKGHAGSVIEVRSGHDGAGCGFEFPADERIGAFIHIEGSDLHGGLCSQVDADALLAAWRGRELNEGGSEALPSLEPPGTTATSAPDPTTPPLVAPELDVVESPSAGLQWLAGSALALFVAGLVWLTRRPG